MYGIRLLSGVAPQPNAVQSASTGTATGSITRSTTQPAKAPAQQNAPATTAPDNSVLIVALQAQLVRVGCLNGAVDGIIGPNTRAAVRAQLAAYVKAHPRNATGAGRFSYSLEVFGTKLSEVEIRRRFDFYTRRFLSE